MREPASDSLNWTDVPRNVSFLTPAADTLLDPLVATQVVVLCVFILLTICGNLLVIVAVALSPALRTPTHFLIVNLAVADLLLGVTVLPMSAVREIAGGAWLLGQELCSAWTTLDVLCCTASILSLCVISVDRYIGVSRPLAYSRILSKTRARGLIAGIWALALAISIAPSLGWREELSPGECHVNKQLSYVIFSASGSFYLPALVIIVLYTLVYRAAAKHSTFLYSGSRVTRSDVTLRVHMGNSRPRASLHNIGYSPEIIHTKESSSCSTSPTRLMASNALYSPNGTLDMKNQAPRGSDASKILISGLDGRIAKFQRQKKAAKTLGIVVGGFLLCWFPFFIILPMDAACSSCNISDTAFDLAFWLGYFNSCLNPVIYACTSRELRRAFRHILCRGREHRLRSSAANFKYASTTSLKRVM